MFKTEAVAQEQDYSEHVMVALRPDLDLRDTFSSLRVASEETDDMHLTLWYGGKTDELGGEWGRERLYRALYGLSLEEHRPLKGQVNGFGWFLNDDSHVLLALWDIPYLSTFRQALLDQLALHGVPMREENHGFTPHMTLTYQDETDYTIPKMPTGGSAMQSFDSIWLVWGEDWQEIPLR